MTSVNWECDDCGKQEQIMGNPNAYEWVTLKSKGELAEPWHLCPECAASRKAAGETTPKRREKDGAA